MVSYFKRVLAELPRRRRPPARVRVAPAVASPPRSERRVFAEMVAAARRLAAQIIAG